MAEAELFAAAKELRAPYELVDEVAAPGRLPVVLFTAGGIATPADAAMMMQLGAEGVFVGSGIFKSRRPGQARRGDRQGHDVLRRPRRHRQGRRAASARPWSASTSTTSPSTDRLRRTAAGDPARPGLSSSASSPCRATSASTSRRSRRCGARHAAGAPVEELAGVDAPAWSRAASPRHGEAGAALRAYWSRCATLVAGGLPGLRLLRRDDHAGRPGRWTAAPTRSASAAWTSRCGATRSAGRSTRSRPTSTMPGVRRRARCTPCSSAPRGSSRSGRGGGARCGSAGPAAGTIVAVRQGHVLATSFHPELTGDPGSTRASSLSSSSAVGMRSRHERPLQVGDHQAQEGRRSTPSAASCSPS